MSTKLKVAVIGVGSLGKEHARIYAELAAAGRIEFAGVHDSAPFTAARIAEKLGVRRISLSITHTAELGMAHVILED